MNLLNLSVMDRMGHMIKFQVEQNWFEFSFSSLSLIALPNLKKQSDQLFILSFRGEQLDSCLYQGQ